MEGYATSKYSGVNGVAYNVAGVVDSRVKLDINFAQFSGTIDNNFIGLGDKFLTIGDLYDSTKWESVIKNFEPTALYGYAAADLLGPSFMFTLSPKTTIGFTTSARSLTNIEGIDPTLAGIWRNGLANNYYLGTSTTSDISIHSSTWYEYGIVYGREIYRYKNHWLSGGVRFKLTSGAELFVLEQENLSVTVNNDSTLNISGAEGTYYASANSALNAFDHFKNFSNLGYGLDLGFNYEFRPGADSLFYEMDGKEWPIREVSTHQFRFGLALNDILGSVNYNLASGGAFDPNNGGWDPNAFAMNALDLVDSAFVQNFGTSSEDKISYALPATMGLQFDVRVYKGIYANFTHRRRLNNNVANYQNTSVLTARLDWKWLGVYVPVTYTEKGKTFLGVNVMFGPFLLGTSNLNYWLNNDPSYAGNVHFGIKVTSLHKRPEDYDGDRVSDALDKCIEVPGKWQFEGCPDSDNDSVPDAIDKCPKDSGLVKFRGCPDSDGDGVIDLQDECPFVPGVAKLNGCPDKDGDGIKDALDECPDQIGLAIYNGCPDSDGDSIVDHQDLCPNKFGLLVNGGCPDSDGDGVFDHQDTCVQTPGAIDNNGCPYKDGDGDGIVDKKDACPTEFGPASNKGCPLADTDGDSLVDAEDDCPKTAGPVENGGCPILEDDEEEILDFAFKNLHFETGEDVILAESFASLDALAELLKSKPTWQIKLGGHTDNVGDAQDNLVLSKDRVESTKRYLVEHGVDPKNIILEYFGETKPVDTNDTPEGRQNNRRVEMEIVFE